MDKHIANMILFGFASLWMTRFSDMNNEPTWHDIICKIFFWGCAVVFILLMIHEYAQIS